MARKTDSEVLKITLVALTLSTLVEVLALL